MEKTADLTVVQKTIIDTLHKEGKPQTFIAMNVMNFSTTFKFIEMHLYMYVYIYIYIYYREQEREIMLTYIK